MYNKVLQTDKLEENSVFLFGARGTELATNPRELEENSVFLFGARQTGKPMLPIAYVNQIIL